MPVRRIKTAMSRIKRVLLDPATSTLHDAVRTIGNLMSNILPRIGKPMFDPKFIVEDADPDPAAWNANLENIEDDLRTLYEEYDELRQLRVAVSNAASLASKELEEKANLAQSLLTDLRLTSGQLDQEVIVVTDNFLDMTKIDQNFPLQLPMAEVNTMHGSISLRRISAVNVVTEDAKVEVAPIGPSDLARDPTPNNTMRFYEGRFYAPLGEARPEGGRWHLEERVKPGVVVNGDSNTFIIDGEGEDIFNDFPDLRPPVPEGETEEREAGLALRPDDIIVTDRGASLPELLESRKRGVDGSPDSFWECEFVIDAPRLDEIVEEREATDQVATPQELRAAAANPSLDQYDFEVELVISMPRRQTVNFITINPMNFEETAWLEITEVSTAETQDDAFVPIEGFDEQIFENVLTDEVNTEITENEASTVLAPSKYAYRGQGVYSFAPRNISRLRVRLKQRTPVPSNYERVVIQLTRTLSSTETSADYDTGGII